MWNVETGQQVHRFDGLGKVSRARFCYHDNCILIDMNKKLAIRSASTGKYIKKIISLELSNVIYYLPKTFERQLPRQFYNQWSYLNSLFACLFILRPFQQYFSYFGGSFLASW